jgi:hypothetical protein
MDRFERVQSLRTSVRNYAIGGAIKFWDTSDRLWRKGEIVDITKCAEYFVNVEISYRNHNKRSLVQIYREDWLMDAPRGS